MIFVSVNDSSFLLRRYNVSLCMTSWLYRLYIYLSFDILYEYSKIGMSSCTRDVWFSGCITRIEANHLICWIMFPCYLCNDLLLLLLLISRLRSVSRRVLGDSTLCFLFWNLSYFHDSRGRGSAPPEPSPFASVAASWSESVESWEREIV